jgi:ABC-type Mn2+/Zn2+ transport system permease subunit
MLGEMLAYGFMRRALAAGLLTGILASTVSFFVYLRGLSFATSGIAHAAFGGVALGLVAGLPPVPTAAVFALALAWLVGFLGRGGRIEHQNAVGIVSAAAMALGVVIVGLSKSYVPDLYSYLFGNILAVRPADLAALVIVGAAVLTVIGLAFRQLLFLTFDGEAAEAAGLPAAGLDQMLLAAVALTVVLTVRVLGIILATALLIAPAATGFQLATNYRGMILLSIGAGVAACIGGLWLSYAAGLASGATITLCSGALFGLSVAWARCGPGGPGRASGG